MAYLDWGTEFGGANNKLIITVIMTECVSHISNLKVLSHEEVEGGTGMGSDGANATATIPQETQAQVSTLLCLLLKQQLWKLNTH